jgi:hypothetical protein
MLAEVHFHAATDGHHFPLITRDLPGVILRQREWDDYFGVKVQTVYSLQFTVYGLQFSVYSLKYI